MYDQLFKVPAVVARYRAGPYADLEQFLEKARADGYSPLTLERMAWALLVVAEIVRDAGGSITSKRLRGALLRQVKSKWRGHSPSQNTIKLILQSGEPWLRSMGALAAKPDGHKDLQPNCSPIRSTCASSAVFLRRRSHLATRRSAGSCSSLPPQVRSLGAVTISHVDAFLKNSSLPRMEPQVSALARRPFAHLLSLRGL